MPEPSTSARRTGARQPGRDGHGNGRVGLGRAKGRQDVVHRLQAQYAVSGTLARATTLDEAAPEVLRTICDQLAWDAALLWLTGDDGRLAVSHAHAAAPKARRFTNGSRRFRIELGATLPGLVLRSKRPHWIVEASDEPGFARASLARTTGIRSGFGFPVRAGRRVLGVIECFSFTPRPRDRELLAAMAGLGPQIGVFIERVRAERQLRKHARQQAVVAGLGQRALATTDLQRLMDDAVHLICETLDVEYAKVLELLPSGKALRLVAGEGWRRGLTGKTTVSAGAESQAGYTLMFSKPVVVADLATETRFRGPPLLFDHKVVSGASVIIHGPDRPFGVLGVHTKRHRSFTTDDVNFLQAIANILATAIERKRGEEALLESERRYRSLFDNNLDAVFSFDLEGKFTSANPAVERITGYGASELVGTSFAPLVEPEDLQRAFDHFTRAAMGEPQNIEIVIHDRTGRRINVDVTAIPIVVDGRTTGVFGIARDVTERKRQEAAIRESEARLRAVVETAADGIITIDTSGVIESVNSAVESLFGYAAEELVGQRINVLMPSPYTEEHDGYLTRYLETGERRIIGIGREVRGLRNDGSEFPMYLNVSEMMLGDRRLFTGILHDLSRQKADEEARLESERRATVALEAGRMGAWEWHIDSGEVRWSEALAAIHGLAPSAFPGTFEAFQHEIHPDDREYVTRQIGNSIAHGTHEVEYRIIRSDGAVRWVQGSGRVIYDEDGTARRLVGVCMDVTERKNQENALRRANEAKDEFLGLISHELRTPITTIYGGARLLRARTEYLDAESRREIVTDIEHEAERLHRIVEDLLVLSRMELGGQIDTEPLLIRRVLDKVITSWQQRRPARPVHLTLNGAPKPVLGEPTYLEQVLRNLLSNADKYSPEGAAIEVRVATNRSDEVIVSVLDEGPGVPQEDLEHIFDRFYRAGGSPSHVGGTGIGLTVCRRLIEAQKGRIWAAPRENGGLEVSFALPAFREE